jgi:hypothetical protein
MISSSGSSTSSSYLTASGSLISTPHLLTLSINSYLAGSLYLYWTFSSFFFGNSNVLRSDNRNLSFSSRSVYCMISNSLLCYSLVAGSSSRLMLERPPNALPTCYGPLYGFGNGKYTSLSMISIGIPML